MPPGQVWLMLIPFFSFIWGFVLVTRVASSLANEFARRRLPVEAGPGKSLGLAYCSLVICCVIPLLGMLAAVGALVCGILYWVKIAKYSAPLDPSLPAAGVEV
jgi:hypothetical protein